MLKIDQIYRYRSLAAQRQGYCRLRIYNRRGNHLVVLTEVANNPGQSITAASEVIATGLVKRYRLNPATTRWIEHWPADTRDEQSEASYAAVKYDWQEGVATSPHWQALSLERAEAMMEPRRQAGTSAALLANADDAQQQA
jgi:hypothetical protein